MSTTNDERPPAFLIMGAPGAGKGTQGKILGTIPRFFHFSCGDVFRSLDTRSALGQRFVEYSSRGELVPDELTIELWLEQLNALTETHAYKPDIDGLVLDGIPRNADQARMLGEHVQVHQVFHLSCPDRTELARRMRKRALKDNRMDDASDEVITRRIATYEEDTRPILEFYSDEMVTEIDATQPPIKVAHDLLGRIVSLPIYAEMAKLNV